MAEAQLAYVGITRARQQLVLCHAESRRIYGSDVLNAPSCFLREIRKRCCARYVQNLPQPFARGAAQIPARNYGHAALDAPPIRLGANVRHPKFGTGFVTDVEGNVVRTPACSSISRTSAANGWCWPTRI